MSILITIFVSLISSSGITLLLKEWLSAKIKGQIQHEYDKRLEELKANVSREVTFYTTAHASFMAGQKAAMERKLNAIDQLWKTVVDFRLKLPSILSFIDILTVNEYKGAKDHPQFKKIIGTISEDKIVALVPQGIEEVRPYIGEYLWSLFYSYRAIFLRISLLLYYGRDDVEKMEWHKDSFTRQLIAAVFSQDEVKAFDQMQFQKITWLREHLEGKILNAIHKIISGEDAVPKSLEQIQLINQSVSQIMREIKTKPE